MEPYLKQWFIHEHGGVTPVSLLRNSPERNIIQAFISTKPSGWVAQPIENGVPIEVPVIHGLDPEYWCFLPPRACQTLYNCIKSCFDSQLFGELHTIRSKDVLLTDLIYAFMEKHGIEDTETNWNTLAKIYKRKRDSHDRKAKRKVNKS